MLEILQPTDIKYSDIVETSFFSDIETKPIRGFIGRINCCYFL